MILMRSLVTVPAMAAVAVTVSGCAAFSDSAADDGALTVAAAFYPLQFVSERVAGEHAEVTALTQSGTEPHDLELDVRETGVIVRADLVVYESGFQPAVDDSVEQNAEGAVLDAADVVALVAAEESHEEHESHFVEEGHDHGDVDPHFWQDPLRMADLGDSVADELAEIDPDHAGDYERNAARLRAELESLDASYEAGLADCERDTIVVSHDAFGYLEKYDVHLAPIVGLSPDAEPTASVLGELQELIRTEGITTVFSEPLEPALGEGLASDLGLTEDVLDPVEGLTDESAREDYFSLMEANLQAIREANACR
jgi:zinc transport system substrate-binding protein